MVQFLVDGCCVGLHDLTTCFPLSLLLGAIDDQSRKNSKKAFRNFVPRSAIRVMVGEGFVKVV